MFCRKEKLRFLKCSFPTKRNFYGSFFFSSDCLLLLSGHWRGDEEEGVGRARERQQSNLEGEDVSLFFLLLLLWIGILKNSEVLYVGGGKVMACFFLEDK